jgi:hypothetical protein
MALDDDVSHASSSGGTDEITAAVTQIMSSLEDLAKKCRGRGTDPMAMIMTILSGSARGTATGVAASAVPAAIDAAATDAELAKRSRDLIDAMDRGDIAAVEATLAPGFVGFKGGPPVDRAAVLAAIGQRRASYIATRTWSDERLLRRPDAVVFLGRAHEVGSQAHGGYLFDGWYLLQWVPTGGAWRVQLLTWQRESTERDWWNDTFHNGRGFSREPNRLLVETIRDERPGTALELAMGQGRNALYLASHGWKVTGVDLSEEALRIAGEQAIERKLALETVKADLDHWDFGDDRFDLVVLMYAGDHAKWIDKIKASLRAGGLFVLEGWAKGSPDSPLGFGVGQLATWFEGYDIVRDDTVVDVPDWAWDKGELVRFVARKR